MSDLEYLDPRQARFRLSAGNLLSLDLAGRFFAKVDLHLAFPFSQPQRFISVREPEGEEIGLIKDLRELDENSQKALKQELEWRYYTPQIQRIKSYKEEFGHSYWEVETDRGPLKFVTRRRGQNVRSISSGRVLVTDVSGNRFEIRDVGKLDGRSRFYLETLL